MAVIGKELMWVTVLLEVLRIAMNREAHGRYHFLSMLLIRMDCNMLMFPRKDVAAIDHQHKYNVLRDRNGPAEQGVCGLHSKTSQ